MFGYLSPGIICSEKQKSFSHSKTVSVEVEIMSKDKIIILTYYFQIEAIVFAIVQMFFWQHACFWKLRNII